MKILVVAKSVGEPARAITIENDLAGLRSCINNGYLEHIHAANLPEALRQYTVYADEEGKLKGLPPHVGLNSGDFLCGPFVVCQSNEDGDTVSLTESEATQLCTAINLFA